MHRDKCAKFVVAPILNHTQTIIDGLLDLSRRRLFEIKEIGAITARTDLTSAINQIGFAQAALDLALAFAQKLAWRQLDALVPGIVDAAGKRLGV